MTKTGKWILPLVAGLLMICPAAPDQETSKGDYDVISYKIDGELIPEDHRLKAQVDMVIRPLKDTQSAVMELNGSLKVAQVLDPIQSLWHSLRIRLTNTRCALILDNSTRPAKT